VAAQDDYYPSLKPIFLLPCPPRSAPRARTVAAEVSATTPEALTRVHGHMYILSREKTMRSAQIVDEESDRNRIAM